MTCDMCSEIQEKALNKNYNVTMPIAYVRIEESNIAIIGCKKHLKILIERLRT